MLCHTLCHAACCVMLCHACPCLAVPMLCPCCAVLCHVQCCAMQHAVPCCLCFSLSVSVVSDVCSHWAVWGQNGCGLRLRRQYRPLVQPRRLQVGTMGALKRYGAKYSTVMPYTVTVNTIVHSLDRRLRLHFEHKLGKYDVCTL